MESAYNIIEEYHRRFRASDQDRTVFERVAKSASTDRDRIVEDIVTLRKRVGLGYALIALYKQQVNSGFVLADPLGMKDEYEKRFFDPETNITFRVQWNPDRELRRDHALLINRGIIAEHADESKLIHRSPNGKPCYLCKSNIDAQNPGEILLEVDLAGEAFYVGANFASITYNHFTVMNAEHHPQDYRREILSFMNDFGEKTDGCFRAVFNGLAGASIKKHEHLQATTEPFPIEEIWIGEEDAVRSFESVRVSCPRYILPVWIVEGRNKESVERAADAILSSWHGLDASEHTENIISVLSGNTYRTFIILRERTKLVGPGKMGVMASFETGGIIVLSTEAKGSTDEVDERETFRTANLKIVRSMLKGVSPDAGKCARLLEEISVLDFGIQS